MNKKRQLKKSFTNTIYRIHYILIVLFISKYLIYSININNIIVYILYLILVFTLLGILLILNNMIKNKLEKIRF